MSGSAAPERQKHVERQKLEALLGYCETTRCRRQVLLGYPHQEFQAFARLAAQLLGARALGERGHVLPRQPVEEHRALVVVREQADEGELGARRVVQHHGAVAGEDGGHDLAAELSAIALEEERLVAVERDEGVLGAFFLQLLLRVAAAGFERRGVVLGRRVRRGEGEE